MSEQTVRILQFLAEGCTVEEIFWHDPALEYADIGRAAQAALQAMQHPVMPESRLERMRRRYPKAFAKWSEEEQDLLIREFLAGSTVSQLSGLLQRQPGAIKIRLEMLGLFPAGQSVARRFPVRS